MFASLLSTISYLSMTGEVVGKGPAQMASLLGYPIIFIVVGFVLLPIYMRQRVTSAYELLDQKLGRSVRLLGVVLFLILRLVWMSLLIYLTGVALATILNIDEKWVPLIVLIAGHGSPLFYTSLGGLKAVVITDLLQTILLFGGALLVIATVTWKLEGFSWVPTQWQPDWDTQPFFSFDPATRITVFRCHSLGDLLADLHGGR